VRITTFGPGGYQAADPTQNVVSDVVVPDDPTVVNRDGLIAKAQAAIASNSTFLAIVSPTNPQVLAQVQRLTRECTAVIKLLLDDLQDVSGT